jgi:hypothetical protein
MPDSIYFLQVSTLSTNVVRERARPTVARRPPTRGLSITFGIILYRKIFNLNLAAAADRLKQVEERKKQEQIEREKMVIVFLFYPRFGNLSQVAF